MNIKTDTYLRLSETIRQNVEVNEAWFFRIVYSTLLLEAPKAWQRSPLSNLGKSSVVSGTGGDGESSKDFPENEVNRNERIMREGFNNSNIEEDGREKIHKIKIRFL